MMYLYTMDQSWSTQDDSGKSYKNRYTNNDIGNYVCSNIEKYLNKHRYGKGIWYAPDYFKYLRKNGIYLDKNTETEMYDGFTDPNFFDKIGIFSFIIKPGKRPSEAIIKFLEGPTIADCGLATIAIYFKTIMDLMGSDLFDQTFDGELFITSTIAYPLNQHVCYADNYLINQEIDDENNTNEDEFIRNYPCVPQDLTFKIGDHIYIGGIRWYANKHPEGFEGGWNVIYVGDNEDKQNLFAGHGFKNPLTIRQINEKFVKDYNTPRTRKDWEYIKKQTSKIYDKNHNIWLKQYYVIDVNEALRDPNKFFEGCFPETRARILL